MSEVHTCPIRGDNGKIFRGLLDNSNCLPPKGSFDPGQEDSGHNILGLMGKEP